MPKYRIVYSYLRYFQPDLKLDLAVKDNWDGEELVEIETDLPIGDGAEGLTNDVRHVSKSIATDKGYEAVVLTDIREIVETGENTDG